MNSRTNDGGPAFPTQQEHEFDTQMGYWNHEGMTLRDYFAGQALSGIIAQYPTADSKTVARYTYQIADAMIEASKND